jgi:hypothetical protein
VDLDEFFYGGDDIEYCLLYAYVGKVGILVLPRTSCYVIIRRFIVGVAEKGSVNKLLINK